MQSLWNDHEAARYNDDLALRVYTSRLIGREPALVLHGGGNTSVKMTSHNILGEAEDILCIKGSGRDLATIEARDFALVRLQPLARLTSLATLSDVQMAKELKTHITDPAAPPLSVEALMHAVLPFRYVDHTHADALLAISNTPDGLERIREVYGDLAVIIPYVRSGFPLAKRCDELFRAAAGPQTIGLVLMHHGLVSFGDTAQIAYERMIDLVTRAEQYLARHAAWQISFPTTAPIERPLRQELAVLRRDVSRAAGFPVIMTTYTDAQCVSFVRRNDVRALTQQGPVTPDHVIRTKRTPLYGRDVSAFVADYQQSFAAHAAQFDQPLTMLDPAPRVILDQDLGMCAIGRTVREAAIVNDIYRHTIEIMLRATALAEYQALPARDMFAVEYWDLEQAKLHQSVARPPFTGEIVLITGAASGIGKACVDAFLARGAAVVGLDINPQIMQMYDRPDFLGQQCDVTDEQAIDAALEVTVRAFGGLDMLVLNAGIFPASCRIDAISLSNWQKVMRVNLDANLILLHAAHPLLKTAPQGGRVAIIGSKNVPAPGPGAAAYSASKAALNQLARVAALEWGADHIRINTLHPNAVFDTGLWTDEVLQARAANYGLTVDQYKRNNVLQVEVTSRDVAELAAEMCGQLFAKITGAQLPIDGGNERVI